MRIELERSGGLLGRTVSWSLDTEALPAAEAAELAELAAAAATWAAPPAAGADRFHYRLRLSGGDRPVEVSFGEPGPPAAQRLVDRLRRTSAARTGQIGSP